MSVGDFGGIPIVASEHVPVGKGYVWGPVGPSGYDQPSPMWQSLLAIAEDQWYFWMFGIPIGYGKPQHLGVAEVVCPNPDEWNSDHAGTDLLVIPCECGAVV